MKKMINKHQQKRFGTAKVKVIFSLVKKIFEKMEITYVNCEKCCHPVQIIGFSRQRKDSRDNLVLRNKSQDRFQTIVIPSQRTSEHANDLISSFDMNSYFINLFIHFCWSCTNGMI